MNLAHSPGTQSRTLALAIAGSRSACEELFAAHRQKLTTLSMHLLRNREDAADAVQETLIKAFQALPDFDPERPLGPWLCRICSNCCVDAVRNRNRKPEILGSSESCLIDATTSVEEAVGESVLRNQIVQALERVPVRYRRILFMRHFQHKDVNQIAFELHKPEGTVKSWLFRGRNLLRKELAFSLS